MSVEPRRSRHGGYVVPVDSLKIGDRLEFTSQGRASWWPILDIDEYPETRRVACGVQSSGQLVFRERMRRTTLITRAPRDEEAR